MGPIAITMTRRAQTKPPSRTLPSREGPLLSKPRPPRAALLYLRTINPIESRFAALRLLEGPSAVCQEAVDANQSAGRPSPGP